MEFELGILSDLDPVSALSQAMGIKNGNITTNALLEESLARVKSSMSDMEKLLLNVNTGEMTKDATTNVFHLGVAMVLHAIDCEYFAVPPTMVEKVLSFFSTHESLIQAHGTLQKVLSECNRQRNEALGPVPPRNITDLLAAAILVFSLVSSLKTAELWILRAYTVLLSTTDMMNTFFPEIYDTASKHLSILLNSMIRENPACVVIVEAELAMICSKIGVLTQQASMHAKKASELNGLDIKIRGVSAKSFRSQEKYHPQLYVVAENKNMESIEIEKDTLPEHSLSHIRLDDPEIPMDFPILEDESIRLGEVPLSVVDESLLLTYARLSLFEARDGFGGETFLPFVRRILVSQRSTSVLAACLFERCKYEESDQKKSVRSQRQENEILRFLSTSNGQQRRKIADFFLSGLPSIRQLRWSIANKNFLLFNYVEAFKHAEDVGNWRLMMDSLVQLGEHERAIGFVEELLKDKREGIELLSVLGSLRRDESLLLRAWNLSGGKDAEPLKRLVDLLLRKEDYAAAVPHLEEIVKIIPEDSNSAFRLGYAYLQTNKREDALSAFQRVVRLDPESTMAWSNIATLHILKGDFQKAFIALTEAIKIDRNNGKIWLNMSLISIEIDEYGVAMEAVERCLDLRVGGELSNSMLVTLAMEGEASAIANFIERFRKALERLVEIHGRKNIVLMDLLADVYSRSSGDLAEENGKAALELKLDVVRLAMGPLRERLLSNKSFAKFISAKCQELAGHCEKDINSQQLREIQEVLEKIGDIFRNALPGEH